MSESWPDLAGRIIGNKHILQVRIYYEETDFSGYVYHANYLKLCERGRSDCLRLLDIHHTELFSQDGEGRSAFVVRHMDCDFIAPALIDDVLEVHTQFVLAKGARMVIDQIVFRGEKRLFSARVTAAFIDEKGRPKRLTQLMLDGFSRLSVI